jgi:hypothetical protein
MNQLPSLIFAASLLASPLLAQTAAPPATANPPLATAVLNFQTADDTVNKQGADVATLLEADLSNSPNAIMVERQDVDKILGEHELGMSGMVSADSAAKIGSLTGAQVLVTGRLFAVGTQNMLVAKIISTETSRVYGVTVTVNDPANLAASVQELSDKIDKVLGTNHDVMVVRQETPEQHLARLRGLVSQPPLPTVTVNITERDYTQPTIDPAAQTEIMKTLEQLGYTIIDASNVNKKADILISGEAFSEFGARRGNLVSSLGRIELKVTRTSNGDLLWTDRETRVAVDLGSRTAGKEALQKSAQILLERIVPKLTK